MFDKRKLKEMIENIPTETSENYPHYEVVNKEKVLNLFVELDEPEILSQKLLAIPVEEEEE